MKRKTSVYLTEETAARLGVAAKERGATKSGLIEAALNRFLDATDAGAEQSGIERRLNWMSRQLEHLDRDLRIVNETVAIHARYHLAVTPAMPKAAQHAACAIGSQRFEEFAAQVGRRVHLGRPLMRETLDRISVTSPHLFESTSEDDAPFSAEQNRQGSITPESTGSALNGNVAERPAAAREVSSNTNFPERSIDSSC